MKIATKDMWKTTPMTIPKKLDISIWLNDKQCKKLKLGLIPKEMEDKWFVYIDNEHLHMHRSWTGYEIFKAKFKAIKKGGLITELWVEQNNEIYADTKDSIVISTFEMLIKYLANRKISNPVKDGILGLVVGDALGVPVEFKSREYMQQNPLKEMFGFGVHNQPLGTWSDDSALTLCLADELAKEFNLQNIGNSFVRWLYENHWTAHGTVFDIGIATQQAIKRLKNGEEAEMAGNCDENSNGNGSLMRILPLLLEIQNLKSLKAKYDIVKKVSSITHRHIRSCLACFYYLEFAACIASDMPYSLIRAYEATNYSFNQLAKELAISPQEMNLFARITDGKLFDLEEKDIQSSGYVIHTLEASIWCLLTTKSYKQAVLKAVNLGEDTDTTGAVVGGLAGLFYGFESIPEKWLEPIAKKADIERLIDRLSDRYQIARC